MEVDEDSIQNVSTTKNIPIDVESFYEGRVFGEQRSSVRVHLEDGLLTAKIETPEETYHIEPSWRHIPDEATSQTMIAYKDSDVIHPEESGKQNLNKQVSLHTTILHRLVVCI